MVTGFRQGFGGVQLAHCNMVVASRSVASRAVNAAADVCKLSSQTCHAEVMRSSSCHIGMTCVCCALQLVRRWKLGSLVPADADALFCHNYNVRSLSAGKCDILVSGDSSGEIAIWQV